MPVSSLRYTSNSRTHTEPAPPDPATPSRSPGRSISRFFKLAKMCCPSMERMSVLCEFLMLPPVTSPLSPHPTTPQALSAALRTPVDIVNQVLTFLTALGILLGLWMCLSARQGGFAL